MKNIQQENSKWRIKFLTASFTMGFPGKDAGSVKIPTFRITQKLSVILRKPCL